MKNRVIASIVALGALSLSACSNSQAPNPCTVWIADNGAYLVQYKAKNPADSCVAAQGFDGQYDNISAQIYPKADGTTELDLLPVDVVEADADGFRLPTVKLASGNFDNAKVGSDDRCTAATLSEASNTAGDTKFAFSNLTFVEDAIAQGTAFQGDVNITAKGCTTAYTVTALGPQVACASNADCLPVPNPAEKRYFSSGIAGEFHTFCDLGAAATTWTGDPATGVCFFADPFPSICPNQAFEGEAGSACPVGK